MPERTRREQIKKGTGTQWTKILEQKLLGKTKKFKCFTH